MVTKEMSLELKTMIDKPMRKSVAMLSLLKVKTIWSCCGFDYRGQEKWRKHIIGSPQIIVKANPVAFKVITKILDDEIFASTSEWVTYLRRLPYQPPIFLMQCCYSNNSHVWDESVHYHERMVTAIKHLEDKLLEFKGEFLDHTTIQDTNKVIKKELKNWNFPSSTSWSFSKEEILKM